MRFFGLGWAETQTMSAIDFEGLWQAMERIEAHEILWSFKSASFPQMKPESRQKLESTLRKRAYPESFTPKQYEQNELVRLVNRGR